MSEGRTAQKQRTREQLYAAAMTLFDEHGYEGVNIDDVVRKTGVARGTFYFHFPTKDDVLLEAVRRGEALILARVAALPAGTPLAKTLETVVAAFAEAWGERRALLPYAGAVSLRRIASVADERDHDPLRVDIGRRMEAAQAKGELRSPLPGGMLADVFLLNVFAALMTWAARGEPPLDVLLPGVVALFFHGIEGLAGSGGGAPESDAKTAGARRAGTASRRR